MKNQTIIPRPEEPHPSMILGMRQYTVLETRFWTYKEPSPTSDPVSTIQIFRDQSCEETGECSRARDRSVIESIATGEFESSVPASQISIKGPHQPSKDFALTKTKGKKQFQEQIQPQQLPTRTGHQQAAANYSSLPCTLQ